MPKIDHIVHIKIFHVGGDNLSTFQKNGTSSDTFLDIPNNSFIFVDDWPWHMIGIFKFVSL